MVSWHGGRVRRRGAGQVDPELAEVPEPLWPPDLARLLDAFEAPGAPGE